MKQNLHSLDKLRDIMTQLRNPETGCKWDIEQNFDSIAPYTIEEAYEVADAIEHKDYEGLKEELGDLLLQVVYHSRMAEERGYFQLEDVIKAVSDKMIARHPHVFGDASVSSAQDVNALWELQKDKERQSKKGKRGSEKESALDGIALGLPALKRAQKILKRAARAGFEWPDLRSACCKTEEEWSEFHLALKNGERDETEEEFGDFLFTLVNLGRMLELDVEESLRKANRKFETRFKAMELELGKNYGSINNADLSEMLEEWRTQKEKRKRAR